MAIERRDAKPRPPDKQSPIAEALGRASKNYNQADASRSPASKERKMERGDTHFDQAMGLADEGSKYSPVRGLPHKKSPLRNVETVGSKKRKHEQISKRGLELAEGA